MTAASVDRPGFLGRPIGPAFQARSITIPAHGERVVDAGFWRDAIVAVQRGRLEIETIAGGRLAFPPGALVCFEGVRLRALRCLDAESVVLLVISRR
jgi:hypothetical protein